MCVYCQARRAAADDALAAVAEALAELDAARVTGGHAEAGHEARAHLARAVAVLTPATQTRARTRAEAAARRDALHRSLKEERDAAS
ncbi:MAG: hypothetical protein GC206_13230 [Alphaproteobacteria bacterium]|nr:hypothetical protein [Alphaproteobacteria bacterium]